MERLFLSFLLPLSFSKHKRSLHAFLVNRLKVDREETLSDGERTLCLSPQFSSRDAKKGVDKASCHSIPPPRAIGALLFSSRVVFGWPCCFCLHLADSCKPSSRTVSFTVEIQRRVTASIW